MGQARVADLGEESRWRIPEDWKLHRDPDPHPNPKPRRPEDPPK